MSKKITELPLAGSVSLTDLLVVEDMSGADPVTRKALGSTVAAGLTSAASSGSLLVKSGSSIVGVAPGSAWDTLLVNGSGSWVSGRLLPGVCYPEQFGAVGDDNADCSDAFQSALDAIANRAYSCLQLGSKTYRVTRGLIWNATGSLSVVGCGASSSIHATNAVTGAVFLLRNADDIHIGNLQIYGNASRNSSGASTAGGGGSNQSGIEVGYLGGDGTSRLRVSNVTCHNLGGRGLSFGFGDDIRGVQIDNYSANECAYGCFAADASVLTNYQTYRCGTGIAVAAGNVTVVGGDLVNNATAIDLLVGANAAHGTFAGVMVRHNLTALRVRAINNGHVFNGCTFYQGDMTFDGGNDTVSFTGGLMDLTNYTLAGKATFNGVLFDQSYFSSITTTSGSNRFTNCFDIDGSIPSWIQPLNQLSLTLGSNANRDLTPQESQAETIIIPSGTWTVARDVKINHSSSNVVSRRWRFINNNAQAANVRFLTGNALTLASGTRAWIGSDGTDAIEL